MINSLSSFKEEGVWSSCIMSFILLIRGDELRVDLEYEF